MIEVEVHYYHRIKKNKGNDHFIYPYFLVKGHANNGTRDDNLRVCAGISTCVIGIMRLIDNTQYSVKNKSGLFEIKINSGKVTKETYIDEDTNYSLNTLLCQLYDLYLMYPNQFSRFDMYEVKECEEVHGTKEKPKPFRKLKQERMGFCSN